MSHFKKLSPDHELFVNLRRDNPDWWQLLKKQNDCYIDIRKDNTINIYYNGGSMFKIGYDKGYNVWTHTKYVAETGSGYQNYPDIEYIDQNKLDILKDRIRIHFGEKSESGIKASLVCAHNSTYFDTEFAFSAPNPQSTNAKRRYDILRIDLVRLSGDTIEFVELKRIRDNRLLDKTSYDGPTGKEKIITQMTKYRDFLQKNEQSIILYYKKLLEIKSALDLLPDSLRNRNHKEVSLNLFPEAILYIDIEDYGTKQTDLRKKRRDALSALLGTYNIQYEITPGHIL